MSNLNPLYKVVVSAPECWICLGEDEAQNLISLECACRNFVHPKCAQTWFCETKKSNVCDICKVNIRLPASLSKIENESISFASLSIEAKAQLFLLCGFLLFILFMILLGAF